MFKIKRKILIVINYYDIIFYNYTRTKYLLLEQFNDSDQIGDYLIKVKYL